VSSRSRIFWLAVCVLLGFTVVLGRLFHVQVVEHEVWAREARNLVRRSTFVPHRRGAIHDRRGREWVADEEAYELELTWRDFRRGHPVGQVWAARQQFLCDGISLARVASEIDRWALALVRLTPADLRAFARGARIRFGPAELPASAEPDVERRRPRASSIEFYVKALLGVQRSQRGAMDPDSDSDRFGHTYAQLFAEAQGCSVDEVEAGILTHVERSRADLARLAQLAVGEDPEPYPRLLALLDGVRVEVEDEIADTLFMKALGFGAWRVDRIRLSRIKLDWLRNALAWDEARLARWMASREELWERFAQGYLAEHVAAHSKVGSAGPVDRLLSAFAWAFEAREARGRGARAWRDVTRIVGLDSLPRLSAPAAGEGARDRVRPEVPVNVLPFQTLRELRAETEEEALVLLARASSQRAPAEAQGLELARRLRRTASSASPTYQLNELDAFEQILLEWHALVQDAIGRAFDGTGAPILEVDEEFVQATLEERAYVVRDRGSRPRRFVDEPGYELVQLVARYPERFAGFRSGTTTRRLARVLDDGGEQRGEPELLGELLIGKVRAPFLTTMLMQREREQQLRNYQMKREQTVEEVPIILELVSGFQLPDEQRGGTGIEGLFDEFLAGKNGFRETRGLQDRKDGNRAALDLPPRDGLDLVLTLDTELQRAAQRVLERPPPLPPSEDKPDRVWWRYPVGALCVITTDGEVLASASVPTRPGEVGPHQDGQRAVVAERTLRQPRFQPPGSVFKPFIAAWALEFAGLDPVTFRVPCLPTRDELPVYGRVHCWKSGGHGEGVDLHAALEGSCNCYFSRLGEALGTQDLRGLAHAFGFGRPTGVRSLFENPSDLLEHSQIQGALATDDELSDVVRQRLGNGLADVTATPLQVARAYAGLATGKLPQLTFLRRIGDSELGPVGEQLPFADETLSRIGRALERVVTHGTARNKGLDVHTLGFRVAAKTGSADYKQRGSVPVDPSAPLSAYEFEGGVRKHNWIAGWFPAREPQIVFVVYVHDTSTTSSHSTTHLASAFLASEEFQTWWREVGP